MDIFWMAFAFGLCTGVLSWCAEQFFKGWQRAAQPSNP